MTSSWCPFWLLSPLCPLSENKYLLSYLTPCHIRALIRFLDDHDVLYFSSPCFVRPCVSPLVQLGWTQTLSSTGPPPSAPLLCNASTGCACCLTVSCSSASLSSAAPIYLNHPQQLVPSPHPYTYTMESTLAHIGSTALPGY